MRRGVMTGMAVAALALSAAPSWGEEYPAGKPIEMTVMFGAGSAADTTARKLAEGMSKVLKAPIPVVNRTGGGGALGYVYVSQQKPDGYSLVWNSNSISTTYHSGTLTFDYKAFDPVARVAVENPALAVKASSPFKTLKDLVDYAKANPGKVRIGNSGAGSHTHISAEALFHEAGVNVVQVPFNAGQAVVNLLGDRIEAVVQFPAAVVPHVKSGDLRVIAVLGAQRDPVLPQVRTAREQGYKVGLDMWRGVAAPKGTPKLVVARLQEAIKKTVESPEFKEAGATIGFTPAYLPADQFAKVIANDDQRLAEVMRQIGIKKN